MSTSKRKVKKITWKTEFTNNSFRGTVSKLRVTRMVSESYDLHVHIQGESYLD